MLFKVADTVGVYVLEEFIGEGYTGEVWRARCGNGSGPSVAALKFLKNGDPKRFADEAAALSVLRHRGVPRVYGDGTHQGYPYIVMEFVPGETLKDRINRKGAMPLREALRYAGEIAEALDECHSHDIIHRDVKSLNIRICNRDDGSERAVLVDFGILKKMGQGNTLTGTILGSPYYMSPEQAQGHKVSFPTDQYSLGIVLWEMLTGSVPYKGDDPWAVIYQHVNGTPPQLTVPGLHPSSPEFTRLDSAIRRALEKDPHDRFNTCGAFIRAAGEVEPQAVVVNVCQESGLQPGPHCRNVVGQRFFVGTEPRSACNRCQQPAEQVAVTVCPETGLRAGQFCAGPRSQQFVKGQEPTATCPKCQAPAQWVTVSICRGSGLRAGDHCAKRQDRQFLKGQEPTATCAKCQAPPQWVPVTVCRASGLLSGPNCAKTRHQQFVAGHEPRETCDQCAAPVARPQPSSRPVVRPEASHRPVVVDQKPDTDRPRVPMGLIFGLGGAAAFLLILLVLVGVVASKSPSANSGQQASVTSVQHKADAGNAIVEPPVKPIERPPAQPGPFDAAEKAVKDSEAATDAATAIRRAHDAIKACNNAPRTASRAERDRIVAGAEAQILRVRGRVLAEARGLWGAKDYRGAAAKYEFIWRDRQERGQYAARVGDCFYAMTEQAKNDAQLSRTYASLSVAWYGKAEKSGGLSPAETAKRLEMKARATGSFIIGGN